MLPPLPLPSIPLFSPDLFKHEKYVLDAQIDGLVEISGDVLCLLIDDEANWQQRTKPVPHGASLSSTEYRQVLQCLPRDRPALTPGAAMRPWSLHP